MDQIEILADELHKKAERYGYMLAQHALQKKWTEQELTTKLHELKSLKMSILETARAQAALRFDAGLDLAKD